MAESQNPFSMPGEWLKCALHTHSTESDGDLPPAALARQYAAAGFDVLAITDHWRLTAPPPAAPLLMLPGAELTCDLGAPGWTCDLLVYGISEIPADPGGDRRNWLVNEEEHWEQRTFPGLAAGGRYAREQGGVAYLAHPYWTGMDAGPLLDGDHVSGVEVFNASAETECGRGDSSLIWDAALQAGRPLHCIATDDSHMPLFDIGLAWTWVKAAERSAGAVLQALREGHSYASAGPVLHEVHRDGNAVEVACSPCRAVFLQQDREQGCGVVAGNRGRRSGRILAASESGLITRAVIEAPAAGPGYLRVRAVDAAGWSAWTNVL